MFNRVVLAAAVLVACVVAPSGAIAQSVVEQNSNVVGRTPPGYYRGIPGMQDNEVSCAINPILPRNIVCAWNASGGSDDAIGDTWLRFSESLDAGRTFFNRYLNGSNLNPATGIGQQFAADPVMMCWPGGCGTVMLASSRGESGGEGGGIYIQWMADANFETGFRKAFKVNLDRVYRSTGSKFADKPHALYMLDEDNPGTVPVSFEAEMPDGSTQVLTREWPKARILVAFALFNPSKNDIEILSTYTDDYGTNWSNPKQIAVTSGRDQGITIAAIDDTVFYGFRRFANSGDSDDIMGVVSPDRGVKIGKPFVIASDVCVYDAPTLPGTEDSTLASARSNDFPWASQDGSKFVMVYSERRFSSDGGCQTIPGEPSDSRIMATVGSNNGKNWSSPIEVDERPDDEHGFQFMPVVDCVLDVCQIAWWDSRRDSQRTINFLEGQGTPGASAALEYFLGVPILADFHSPPLIVDSEIIEYGYQFKRTADMFTRKVRLKNNGMDFLGESTIASRYRRGLYPDGSGGVTLIERESNPFNVKAYKTNSVPFMSDYSSLTSLKHRFVFDPDNPSQPPYWENNTGLNPLNDTLAPQFWLAWTDARNMRGAIYTRGINGRPPYARRSDLMADGEPDEAAGNNDREQTLTAESVEDFNPTPGVCNASTSLPGDGETFLPLNNRVKDSDIYGAMIEDRTTAWALNPTKTLGLIQRTYVVVAENESDDGKVFRFAIANQPIGFNTDPKTARASWRQLPSDPTVPEFQTEDPTVQTLEAVGPRSSASVALFLVSDESVNPVTIDIYDVTEQADPYVGGALVNSVTLNGAVEAGPLLQADGTPNNFEIHNPFVFAPDFENPDHYNPGHYTFDQANPDQFNPDQYNPDQFNPDLFNPDQFNPDQFNPDQFNPDQFNPDQYNPDQFNPDQFNPDLFNPDQFNPDQFNPDQFNLSLSDSDDLHNAEIPEPQLSVYFERDEGGLVSKVDVNYGLKNVGNTLTPYTVDFAVSDYDVLQLITSGKVAIQLIAWQNKQVDDTQFCEPRIATENRVIAATNNFNVTPPLEIPTINNNRVGALTYFVLPDDILQLTLRFIGKKEHIQFIEGRLRENILSWVFTSQAANTNNIVLFDVEQVINDRTPPTFNFPAGDWRTLEAVEPGGITLPPDYITAEKDGLPVPVSCTPALGSFLMLDEDNGGNGTGIEFYCETDPLENGVVGRFTETLRVIDTMAPFFTNNPYLDGLTVEAMSPAGAVVNYDLPAAADIFGVDDSVDVACSPAPGSTFPFESPGPTLTTVSCVATDYSGNPSSPQTFDVVVEDTSPPVIGGEVPYDPPAPPPDYELTAGSSTFLLRWGPFDIDDAGNPPVVECDPGTLDTSSAPPPYRFFHEFPVGSTTVMCTATDDNGLVATVSFPVVIFDNIDPVIELIGESTITLEAGPGPYTDPGATAIDNNDPDVDVTIDIDSSDVDTTTAGTYTVTITATDPSGNSSTVTRTVIVEFSYGLTGIVPTKTRANVGSSNPLYWAWLDADGNAADSSGDAQMLTITDCNTGEVLINPVGYPGASGFRFKSDNWWQYNWDSEGDKGEKYCASVESGLTGQMQYSPEIRLR